MAEGENHTLVERRDELNATMMEQGCTRDMDKWGTVWSQVDTDRQENKQKDVLLTKKTSKQTTN